MYLNFYRLDREPFHVTPDPEFLFLSESHKQALAAIVYGVKQRKGFITITGPVGSGKTTILRAFLNQADPAEIKVIYLFNPVIPFSTLVANLCREFELEPPANDVPRAVEMLYLALADHYSRGCTIVLLIDEAHNMPVETLENLRMLSNFETTKDKLIQIVLAGQPELEELLKRSSLYQLRQRRAIRATILPLKPKESVDYIKYRLSRAGGDTELFSRSALQLVAKRAHGIPRLLNILCDNALATGYACHKRRIDAGVVREVVKDMEEENRRSRKIAAIAATVIVIVLSVAVVFLLDLVPMAAVKPHSSQIPQARMEKDFGMDRAGQQNALPTEGAGKFIDAAPATEKDSGGRAVKGAAGTTRIARRGDTVFNMIRDVYGINEPKRVRALVYEIMRHNPEIKNADYILEGQRIFFPNANKGSGVEGKR